VTLPGIDNLDVLDLGLMAAVIAGAGLVHGTLGLGFPMVATPMLALATDVRSAILITLLPTITVNVVSILKGGGWRSNIGRHLRLGLFVVIGSFLGTQLLLVVNPDPFRLLLAAMILIYLNLDRLRVRQLPWLRRHPDLSAAGFGLVAGLLAGTVNVMVPLLIIYALELGLQRLAMVQVFNFCFLAGKATQLLTFGAAGVFDAATLAATLPLALVGLIFLLLGMRLRDRIQPDVYLRWLRRLLWLMSAILILQFVGGH
jgi:uncharacterized membrane protein YfcA